MEKTILDKDITLLYVTAASFPEGIMDAHQRLHKIIPFSAERKYFAVSRPENGSIIYRAAAEELDPGEAEKLQLETIVLKKGTYISNTINDYMKDFPAIGRVFQEMLAYPGIDPEGYCVEWYLTQEDMKCMIRLTTL